MNFYVEMENLQIGRLQVIEQKLVELIDAHSKSIDKVYELLRGNGDLQIGRLQVIIDRLEILKKNIASLYELLKGSGDLQVGKLQTIADKLEALKNSLEESVRF
jgi:ABC-type xylose transport system substrate-binding protein